MAPPLKEAALDECSAGELPWVVMMREAGELTKPATKGYELAHPNINLSYELLEHVTGRKLQIQSFKMSMTQDNNMIFKRSTERARVLNTDE